MTVGAFLVLVGTILAGIDLVLALTRPARRPVWLLALAVLLIGVGVLVGGTALDLQSSGGR